MLRIGVCDDEEDVRLQVADMARDLAKRMGITAQVEPFASAEALLFGDAHLLDVVFLDVQMPHSDGIGAARELRRVNPGAIVVLVTGFEEYAVEGYSVDARRFLLKPVSPQKFDREVAPVFREAVEAARGEAHVLLACDGQTRAVSPRGVVYVCTGPGKTVLFQTETDRLATRGTIGEWEGRLGDAFFRCHSAYLVNMAHVSSVETSQILLACGERIPLSKHRRKAFLDTFTHFVTRGM